MDIRPDCLLYLNKLHTPLARRLPPLRWCKCEGRKKIFKFFFSTIFPKNSRKKIFKFIFSNVFPKTAEKINLNIFFLLFFHFPKQQKKNIQIYFLQRFSQNSRKNKFKYFFSAVFPFSKTAEKIYLNILFLLFHIVCHSPARCPPSPLPREHSLFEFDSMW